MDSTALWQLYRLAGRRLLNVQDRDPYSLSIGCFDRRFWGWKLVDFPEATFQRNVYPLAWWLTHDESLPPEFKRVVSAAVVNGLRFARQIQHRDGSFDQAFPNEHSFGATAFLLDPMLKAYSIIRGQCPDDLRESVEGGLRLAADFLCRHDEKHGFISNHLAGAALSLFSAAESFHEERFNLHATKLLDRVLDCQSPEGWFLEYDGADPGYQTLCMYYLAQIYRLQPSERLRGAIGRAVDFLAWFVHPDGTFGGEYGSRRTAVYYPGGLALLSGEFPLAASMTRFMVASVLEERTPNPATIDMGNLAPLLSNYALLIESDVPGTSNPLLPWQQGDIQCDFPRSGLFARSTQRYYAILGASNGGVLKVYDRQKRSLLWNDGGYVGELGNGNLITTQMTDLQRYCESSPEQVLLEAPFFHLPRSLPGPLQFLLLRLLNLTVMRNLGLGNAIKRLLVGLLMQAKRRVPLVLVRNVLFGREQVFIRDTLRMEAEMDLRQLQFGRAFVSIHMASARYYESAETAATALESRSLPHETLRSEGVFEHQVTI